MKDDDGFSILPSDGIGSGADSNDLPDDETGACADPWSALESGIFGDLGDGDLMGYSADQEDLDIAPESTEALILAALRNLPQSRKGRLGIGAAMANEFDDPGEQIAYLMIQERVRNCFIDSASKKEYKDGLDWVFTPLPDKHGRTFSECCEVLRVRPWLIQTRVHFQFYRKGIIFEEEMPFETIPMPEIVRAESAYYGGDEGFIIANMAWMQPGISHQTIATTKKAVNAIYKMEEKGIMTEYGGCWYTTGRNPFLLEFARKSISWSSLWPSNSDSTY